MVDEMKGRTMVELNNELSKMNNSQWEEMYGRGMMSLEKYAPFAQQIEQPPYRFRWVLEKVEKVNRGPHLDVGCNNGALTYLMDSEGFASVGLDVSEKLLETAKNNAPSVEFVKGFADQQIPFPSNHFDVVTALEILEHVQHPEKMIQELLRVLKHGGKLLITVPVDRAFDCNEHLRYFSFYSLGEMIEPFTDKFTICRIYKSGTAEKVRKLFAVEATK